MPPLPPSPPRSKDSSSKDAHSEEALHAALEELYAAPFDSFMTLRREWVVRLRAGGDAAGARSIGAAAKPTRTAWALNQVARRRAELIAAVVQAWRTAAPASADGGGIRDGARRYREAVAEAVREARAILAADSVSLSALQVRRMTETLQALVSREEDREKLVVGRLTRDIEVEDPFAGLEFGTAPSPGKRPLLAPPPGREAPSTQAEDEARRQREIERARIEKKRETDAARASVQATEASLLGARTAAAEAEKQLAQARDKVRQANETIDGLERRLAIERSQLEKLLL